MVAHSDRVATKWISEQRGKSWRGRALARRDATPQLVPFRPARSRFKQLVIKCPSPAITNYNLAARRVQTFFAADSNITCTMRVMWVAGCRAGGREGCQLPVARRLAARWARDLVKHGSSRVNQGPTFQDPGTEAQHEQAHPQAIHQSPAAILHFWGSLGLSCRCCT
jgi:hypothetical protein